MGKIVVSSLLQVAIIISCNTTEPIPVNENKSAGYYKVDFNASKLTSGVYVYTIIVNNFIQSKKMLLVK